jgi:hypothetical protein
MIIDFILWYLMAGILVALYDLYHSGDTLKDEHPAIILLASAILIGTWPMYFVK